MGKINPRATRVIYGGACHDFGPVDFLDLAFEALDQAGVSVENIRQCVKMIDQGLEFVPVAIVDQLENIE